ncbi:MAG: hypothetical protein II747_04285 [Clostridia bacterium]|nr:hypothetical protein [Clostridia bacterium]
MNAELSLAELKKTLSNAEFATDHSRIYDDFVRSLMGCGDNQVVKHPQEYHGQEVIKLVCSQYENIFEYLSADDPKEYERRQHRYTAEWVRFLQNETLPVKEIHVCSSVNQKVFDALCKQESIESLRIKRLTCKKIDAVVNLRSLKKLFIECGSSLIDISPLAELTGLEVLILGQTKNIHDYSVLAALKSLKVLGICSYGTASDTKINVDSLGFLSKLPSLEYVDIMDVYPGGH